MTAAFPFLPDFQGRLARRWPLDRELARRPSCRLMPRDLELVTAVALHGFLTADLLDLAFFRPPTGQRSYPCAHAYDRLRTLWLWGYLARFDLPAPRGALGSVPVLYALGEQGRPYAAQRLGAIEPVTERAPEQLDARFVRHEIAAAAVWAHLRALVRAGRWRVCRWTPERVLRARRLRVWDGARRLLPVLPDGYAELEQPDGVVRCCAIEIDRGTLALARFRRKLRAWELYMAGGQFARDWGRERCDFVVLAPSWERLRMLWKVGRDEVAPASWDCYRFATTSALTTEQFGLADAWLTLGGAYTGMVAS